MFKRFAQFLFVLMATLCFALAVGAQDTSSVDGTASDQTGAVIPGTTVTLTNTQTGSTVTVTTDGRGTYHFFGQQPGSGYKISFAHAGFAVSTFADITLNIGQTRTVNAVLTPATAVTFASVESNVQEVTLNTTDAEIGNNISVEQLTNLPVYDRTGGISQLFFLQPGVSGTSVNDILYGAVAGARDDQSSVTLDGLDVNDIAAGTAFAVVATAPVDSVEQFTGTVAGLDSNIGTGSGGQFQLVTKHGTNKFHGNINEYHRDTTTEANSWFNNFNSLKRPALIRNQFGGDIGGPVLRDKLFFFFDYAGSRIVQSASAEREVPNDYVRAGQLNYINDGPGCDGTARLNTNAGCISTLSPSDIASLDPLHQGYTSNIQSYLTSRYPKSNDPGFGDGINTAGYAFTFPVDNSQNTYVSRVDYQINNSQKLYGRFTINRTNGLESAPEFKTDPLTHPFQDKSYAYVISHVWTLGSNKVNQAYFGANIQKVFFPDLYNPTGSNQYSFTGFDGPYTPFDGQRRRIPIPLVRDDFNWQKGSHSIFFGGLFKWIKTSSLLVNDFNFVNLGAAGSVLSNGFDAAQYPADINPDQNVALPRYQDLFASELGVIGTISRNFNYNNKGQALAAGSGSNRGYRYNQLEAYFGDTWKVSPKLSLTYGVRYQVDTAPYEIHGDESIPTEIPFNSFIAARESAAQSGNVSNSSLPFYSWSLGGPKNHGPNYFNTPKHDFGPRFGFAFSPYSSGKTVFNGSIGIDYDRTVINTINFLQDQISFLFSNSNLNTLGDLANAPRVGSNLTFDGGPIYPAPLPVTSPYTPFVDPVTGVPSGIAGFQGGFVISKDLKDPYSIGLNFGLQQEIPNHFVLKLNYAGRLGRRLLADADANQILDAQDFVGHANQTLVQAFADLTTQLRNGKTSRTVTPEPWFEDVLGGAASTFGFPSNTALVARLAGNNIFNGDISDAIVTLNIYKQAFGVDALWPTNIGIPAQFASNAYLTNQGSSNYHALFGTLSRNYANGLRFDVNYTWSHSIDNNSQSANNNALYNVSGILCDIKQPRACRGDSDFDVRHQINGNFVYELPFGRNRAFASNAPRWLDEAIGGWDISGIPAWRTGFSVNPLSVAFIASDFSEASGIWTGSTKGALKAKVNVDRGAHAVYMFAGGSNGANSVVGKFSSPVGLQFGERNILKGPGAFAFDAGVQKTFPIIADNGLKLIFRADGFNVLNHPVFNNGAVNIVNNASSFGRISSTVNGSSGWPARVGQFSLRLEF